MNKKERENLNKADHYLKKAHYSNRDNPAYLFAVATNLVKMGNRKESRDLISKIKRDNEKRLGMLTNYFGGDNPEYPIFSLEGVWYFINEDFNASIKAFEKALKGP